MWQAGRGSRTTLHGIANQPPCTHHHPRHPTRTSLQLLLVALPLRLPPPALVRRFLRFSLAAAAEYFPVRVVFEGCPSTDYASGPFVVGA